MTKNCYIEFLTFMRFKFVLIAVLFPLFVHAQKISVSNFYLDTSDLAAQRRKTMRVDRNGDKCALIRVQTTQKGFHFDVGTLDVDTVDYSHEGEVWVYVPYGLKHITIRHPELGSSSKYYFPVSIQKGKTYVMEISSDKVFVNKYDDKHKGRLHISVMPAKSSFTLNGMKVMLNSRGEATQELSFGTYTYKVESDNYYPKEGQFVINDSVNIQQLVVNDLKPIMGKLSISVYPHNAEIKIDNEINTDDTYVSPKSLQIGSHKVLVSCSGYKTEVRDVEIKKDTTAHLDIRLTQTARFQFITSPSDAMLYLDGKRITTTPCYPELTTGTYDVRLEKKGYKTYHKRTKLDCAAPIMDINLPKIYNPQNELYIDLGGRFGSFVSFGGAIGGYISNINVEVSAFYGVSKSETIYWCSDVETPVTSLYYPQISVCGKVGYGIPVATRFRLTPQIGGGYLRLKERMQKNTDIVRAAGSNVFCVLWDLRFSAVVAKHVGICVSPEYAVAVRKSNGYKALEKSSPKIKKWSDGLNVKLGLMLTF